MAWLLLPLVAAALRGGALPGWMLAPELALLAIPLRALYWQRGGSAWGDYLGGVAHVLFYFNFLHQTAPFLQVPVALILGLWWLVERAIGKTLMRRMPVGLAAALAVAAVEWFRFQWPMGGVPWGSLALGLADRPIARDWASVIGESGWVVLLAFAGAAVHGVLNAQLSMRARLVEMVPFVVLATLAASLVPERAVVVDSVRTLSVQGNLSINDKHGGWRASKVFSRQLEVTWAGLMEEPDVDFVIWCETMYPYPVVPPEDGPGGEGVMIRPWPTFEEQIPLEEVRWANEQNIQFLVGGPDSGRRFVTGAHFYLGVEEQETWRPGEPRRPETWSPRTSEFLAFLPDGSIEDHFSKTELVPFGERLPFQGRFPGGEWLALEALRATKLYPRFARSGRDGPMETAGHVIGGAVCWENVYEAPFRDQADAGAEAFMILSNENWYGLSEEMDQMVAATRFRASETGRSILRAANTGITALFDDRGAVLGELPRGERAWFACDLSLIDGSNRTPYQRGGWLIQPVLAWLALAGALLLGILGRHAQAGKGPEEGAARSLDPSLGRR